MNTIAKNKTIGNDVLARGSEIEGAQATNITRPLLKWAGGKTQLLGEIIPKIPKKIWPFYRAFFRWRCGVLCSASSGRDYC